MCRCWPCESVKKRAQVGRDMTGPKVCVSLEGTTVKEMADEAAVSYTHLTLPTIYSV